MKLKSISLLLMPALMLLVACEGPGSALEKRIVGPPTATPDIEAMVEARVKEAIASMPIPTPEVVIKEVPVEDLAKVQSLQENVAALKEQVAQAQAANRELEWNYEATIAELRDAIKTAERNIYTLTLEKEALIKELAAASQ